MKFWYQSRTIWIGILEFAIGAGLLLADFMAVGDFTVPAIILLVVGVLKVAMRLLTDTEIVG